jgi:hypothetical protein
MKLQFSLATLLVVTAAVAISCGSLIWYASRIAYPRALTPLVALNAVLADCISLSPCWLPAVFAAYAIGRKRLTPWMVVAFTVAQIGAIVASQVTLFFIRGY